MPSPVSIPKREESKSRSLVKRLCGKGECRGASPLCQSFHGRMGVTPKLIIPPRLGDRGLKNGYVDNPK